MAIERIVVLTDFSKHSDRAFETALELARPLGAQLRVLHCYEELPGSRAPLGSAGLDPARRDQALARMKEQASRFDTKGVEVDYEVHPGMQVARVVLDAVRKEAPGLLVLGTHGRSGIERVLLGSVAEQCVREAPCPVLTVKAS